MWCVHWCVVSGVSVCCALWNVCVVSGACLRYVYAPWSVCGEQRVCDVCALWCEWCVPVRCVHCGVLRGVSL